MTCCDTFCSLNFPTASKEKFYEAFSNPVEIGSAYDVGKSIKSLIYVTAFALDYCIAAELGAGKAGKLGYAVNGVKKSCKHFGKTDGNEIP